MRGGGLFMVVGKKMLLLTSYELLSTFSLSVHLLSLVQSKKSPNILSRGGGGI